MQLEVKGDYLLVFTGKELEVLIKIKNKTGDRYVINLNLHITQKRTQIKKNLF